MKLQFQQKNKIALNIVGALVFLLLFVCPTPILAQTPNAFATPKGVLEAYRRMDAQGERLTVSGWHRGFKFFIKPARRPADNVIGVIDGERVRQS